MKKMIKPLVAIATILFTIFISINIKATGTIASNTTATIESEYYDKTSIRYMSIITGIADSFDVTKTIVHYEISNGTKSASATKELSNLYKSVDGTYGEKENTYYQVMTLTGVDSFYGYTLSVYFEYVFSDLSTLSTAVTSDLLCEQNNYINIASKTGLTASISFSGTDIENYNISTKKHSESVFTDVAATKTLSADTITAEIAFTEAGNYDIRVLDIENDKYYYYQNLYVTDSEGVSKLLDFSDDESFNAKTSGYTTATTAQSVDKCWTITGGNSNNGSWNYLKFGGKNGANQVGTIAMTEDANTEFSSFTINILSVLANTTATLTLEVVDAVASTSDSITKSVDSSSSGDIIFYPTSGSVWSKNSTFTLTITCVNTTSTNGSFSVNSVKLTKDALADTHHHSYINEEKANAYLASAGDCMHKSLYYYSCSCGAHNAESFEGDYGNHSYTKAVTLAATASSTGIMTYTCEICGDEYEEVIPATGIEYPDTDYDSLISTFDELKSASTSTLSSEYYYARGYISSIDSTTYGNLYIKDENDNEYYIYGLYDSTGTNRYDALETKPAVGDFVVLYGQIMLYNSVYEMKNARLYWLNNESMYIDATEGYTLSISTISAGSYSTGNYGSLTNGDYSFIYYRTYNDTLLDNSGYYYDSLEGAFYNSSSFSDIISLSLTYTASSSFTVSYSEDYINYTKINVEASTSNKTVVLQLNDNDYFKIETGNSNVVITSIVVKYTNTGTSYPSYSGIACNRLNPNTYSSTLVAGSSYVDMPIAVTYNNDGTYTINETKRYTYYTLDYVSNNPSCADSAAMITPMDVTNYYLAFGSFPVNYYYKSTSNSNSANYSDYSNSSTVSSLFGSKARCISYYTRTDGYTTAIPSIDGTQGYYELDIDVNGSYSTSSRGVGRIVIFISGASYNGYDSNPIAFYTDDHYASFMEYLNDGTFSNRFCANELITGYKYSNTTYPTTY